MTAPSDAFDLVGEGRDETCMLVHRATGYATGIPGAPHIADRSGAGIRIVATAPPIEHELRVDVVPAETDPQALAVALASAYARNRTGGDATATPLPPNLRASGAVAAARASYTLPGSPKPTIEQLVVTVRPHEGQLAAAYHAMRCLAGDVNPVQWAHVRSAMLVAARWEPVPPTAAPALWPATSTFAEPSAALTLAPAAWSVAQAKAAEIGPLSDEQTRALLQQLVAVANTDDPPAFEVPSYLNQLVARQIAMAGPTRATEALLRNLDEVKTAHDLRAWCWQNIWAIGNRDDRGTAQRTTS